MPHIDPNPDLNQFILRGFGTDHGVYHRMFYYDGTIHGIITLIIREISRAKWKLEEFPDETAEEKAARQLQDTILGFDSRGGLIEGGFRRLVQRAGMFVPYGMRLMETIWRDAEIDGKRRRVPVAARDRQNWSLEEWVYNRETLVGVTQRTDTTISGPRHRSPLHLGSRVVIPAPKTLLFNNFATTGNPEGISALRSAWIPWQAKMDMIRRDQIAQESLYKGVVNIKELVDKNGRPLGGISRKDEEFIPSMLDAFQSGRTRFLYSPAGYDVKADWPSHLAPENIELYKFFEHQILSSIGCTLLGLHNSSSASAKLSDGLGAIAYHVMEDIAEDIGSVIAGLPGLPYTGMLRRAVDVNFPNYRGRRHRLIPSGLAYQDLEKMIRILALAAQFTLLTPNELDEMDFRSLLNLRQHLPEKLKVLREKVAERGQNSGQPGEKGGEQKGGQSRQGNQSAPRQATNTGGGAASKTKKGSGNAAAK